MKSFRRSTVEYLEGDSSIPPVNLWKSQVEDYAGRVAGTLKYRPGEHPAALVEKLGGRIHFQDLDEWLEENGSIFVHGKGDFDILLPQYTSPRRDRFTIGHELGHYYLHSDQGEVPIIAYRQGSTRIEWEANWFAAALLMPKDEFLAKWSQCRNLVEVAQFFGVSQDAAKVRKDALGI